MERLAASRMRGVVVRDAAGVALALRAARGAACTGRCRCSRRPAPLPGSARRSSWR
ncbi:hypothetical protein [Teichococcus aestuarii]|uniref:hypothetical protein n=1 Tax=Teichococcus aestuarii TaxID=568898 RepID=UPI00361F2460